MLNILVVVACLASADASGAPALVCSPMVSQPMPADECADRLAQLKEAAAAREDLHVEGRCVAPGDPA